MARLVFLAIIALGIFVRVYAWGQVPYALNLDEVAIGYTAFSLLKTGADEHGHFLPLMFESFGDWKMPVYTYLTVVPVAIFGLTETAARFISLLSGIASIILIFHIAKNLFKSKKTALISSLFMAISPWSIFFSRMAIEANLANSLFLLGLLLYQKNKRFLSYFCFGLTMFTYHNFLIFTPLFVLGLSLIDLKNIKRNIFGFIVFGIISLSAWMVITTAAGSKVKDVGFFTNSDILYNRVEQFRKVDSDVFEKALHNKFSGLGYHFAQNYISSYNPSFLFDKGGQKILHNTGYTGVLLLVDALFIFAGLLFLLKVRTEAIKILLLWLLIAPISSSITLDHPNSTRMFAALPALLMLASIGAIGLYKIYKDYRRHIVSLIIVIFFSASSLYWLDGYFNFLNEKRAPFMGAGFKEAAQFVKKYPNHNVIWARAQDFPYIYVLFYNQIDPRTFRKNLTYFPTTPEGFKLVKTFDRFSFPSDLNEAPGKPPKFKKDTVYIEKFGVHSDSVSINLPSGDPRFLIYVSDHDGY